MIGRGARLLALAAGLGATSLGAETVRTAARSVSGERQAGHLVFRGIQ